VHCRQGRKSAAGWLTVLINPFVRGARLKPSQPCEAGGYSGITSVSKPISKRNNLIKDNGIRLDVVVRTEKNRTGIYHYSPAERKHMQLHAKILLVALFSLVFADAKARCEDLADVEARLMASLKYLASDELGGRGVGTEGLDLAADYLHNEFSQAGLKTDLFGGRPFQEFEITLRSELGPETQNRLVLLPDAAGTDDPRHPIAFQLEQTFSPLAVGGNAAIKAPLVFVGYGVPAEDA